MKIRQHIPNYVDFEDENPLIYESKDLEGLLSFDWIKAWEEQEGFFRFSIAEPKKGNYLLVAEQNKGSNWWVGWVIGYVDTDLRLLGMPNWVPVKDEQNWVERLENGE